MESIGLADYDRHCRRSRRRGRGRGHGRDYRDVNVEDAPIAPG
jgi:hypothetical protein